MISLNLKMRNIGCPEVTVNALKNKSRDECFPAKNVKKAKKAEVNYCPSHPTGKTDDSLENLWVELLTDVRQRNGASDVREKMSKTFSYRRKEVVHGSPGAAEMKVRWPALFHINEVNTCLLPSSVPLFIVHFHYVLWFHYVYYKNHHYVNNWAQCSLSSATFFMCNR